MTDPLCSIALAAIAEALTTDRRRVPALATLPEDLRAPGATFVTLEHGPRLLGCVGTLEPVRPLGIDVAAHALAAAFDDPRLPALTRAEYPVMSVKVSVLSPLEPIAVCDYDELRGALRPGVDGISIVSGLTKNLAARATFLPSVWPKVRDVDEFLDALWAKAGMKPRVWPPHLQVARYTTVETCVIGPRAALEP
jgi:AmmeMemoRadiSam system protein A